MVYFMYSVKDLFNMWSTKNCVIIKSSIIALYIESILNKLPQIIVVIASFD